jgi:putative membrane protein
MNRDELAIIRTQLANERTFLAYFRTALAFLATGVGILHFFQSFVLRSAGWSILIGGGIIFLAGAIRFISVRRQIRRND